MLCCANAFERIKLVLLHIFHRLPLKEPCVPNGVCLLAARG
jgi:hypothetical protein